MAHREQAVLAIDHDAGLRELRQSTDKILSGRFLQVFCDQVALPDGETTFREYIVHPGAVMVIPLLTDDQGQTRVVLERQFRYPVGQVMIEFPAGKLDPGEDVLTCAKRELLEETGYSARQWARAGLLHPVISYSTEFIEVWFARGLQLHTRKLDEGEFLEVFTATTADLLNWCREGKVTDSKTLIGALWLQNVLSGSWELSWSP